MDKTELAESMADFLKLKVHRPLTNYQISRIFCPDRFFAVWDQLEKEKICVSLGHEGTFMLIKWNPKRARHPLKTGEGKGPDRYTAFYSAVHEIKKA